MDRDSLARCQKLPEDFYAILITYKHSVKREYNVKVNGHDVTNYFNEANWLRIVCHDNSDCHINDIQIIIKHGNESELDIINFGDQEWEYNEVTKKTTGIGEQRYCFGDNWGIIMEKISESRILLSQLPTKEAAKIYLNGSGWKDWRKGEPKKNVHGNSLYAWESQLRDYQIYYSVFQDFVYGINNKTVRKSEVFFGGLYYKSLERAPIDTDYAGVQPLHIYLLQFQGLWKKKHSYFYENITEPLWISHRYHWIINGCLYGQDAEFNIFRSLCFVRYDYVTDPKLATWYFLNSMNLNHLIRIPIGILCLALQILLTIGIVMEVVDNWDIDEMFENSDTKSMIIIISIFTFSFISYTFVFTVIKFFQFYINMSKVFMISWWIIVFDFISNIIIGFLLCMVSWFYLLQSESIADVVLNSFAMTFILELDDLANLFESDEDKLIEDDWYNISTIRRIIRPIDSKFIQRDFKFEYAGYGKFRKRAVIIPFRTLCVSILLVTLSPLFIVFAAVFAVIKLSGFMYKEQHYEYELEDDEISKIQREYEKTAERKNSISKMRQAKRIKFDFPYE